MKSILIVGANFNNKGAQAMLFATVDELKRRMPDCEIYFATTETIDENQFSFKRLYYSDTVKKIALEDRKKGIFWFESILKDCVKFIAGKRSDLWRQRELSTLMPRLDMIIDISGFNLGAKWSVYTHEKYFDNIRLAMKYGVPMALMPQSFGDFEYTEDMQFLIGEMKELLRYPKIIFAREKQGYDLLTKQIGLDNVRLSADLVLQSSGIDYKNIFQKEPKTALPDICTQSNVAVIPNMQCFYHGNEQIVLAVYKSLINILIEHKKNVYLLRHSGEDLECCQKIKGMFPDSDAVKLIENNLSCLEYDRLAGNFDFIICSRFHGIVHAYRNCIPCVILGWEVKYASLAKLMEQENFVFDITQDRVDVKAIESAVGQMIVESKKQSGVIRECVKKVQRDNCFDQLMTYMCRE